MSEYGRSWLEFYNRGGTKKTLPEDPSSELEPVVTNSDDAISLHTQRSITRALYHQLFPDEPGIDYDVSLSQNNSLQVKVVTGSYDQVPGRENHDLWRALHYYTLKVSGNSDISGPFRPNMQLSQQSTKLKDYYRIILNNPKIDLYDRYDFGDVRKVQNTTVGSVINDFLIAVNFKEVERVRKAIGNTTFWNEPLQIGHEDGLRLVEYDLARNFDVIGSIAPKKPLEFYASDDIVRKL